MAFNPANLMSSGQAIGGPVRYWIYLTLDSIDTVMADGYFPASSKLQIGDFLDLTVVDAIDPLTRTVAETATIVIGTPI